MTPTPDLPASWRSCKLGDVIEYGVTRKAEPQDIPPDAWLLELEDIERDSSKVLDRRTFAERKSKSTKNAFATGDVLYGKLRPYLNKVVRADRDGFCTTEIVPLTGNDVVTADYLFYWLKHPIFLDYVSQVSHGLNMPRLGTEAGKQAPFVLAPVPEQRRITAKLDALLGQVDACRERLDRVPGILKRFRQSVLSAATSGTLTADWRTQQARHDGADTWRALELSALCSTARVITYGVIKLGDETPRGVPCLRTSNVRWLSFELDGIKRITKALSEEYGRTILRGGELLVNVRGTLGGVAVATPEMTGWNVSREVAVVPVDPALAVPMFLAYWIGAQSAQQWLGSVEKGVAYTGINIEDLRTLPVRVPPLDEQAEIVRRIQGLLALADQCEAKWATARERVETLPAAILAKAFRGELVPQDPSDAPAVGSPTRGQLVQARNGAEGAPERKPRISRRQGGTHAQNG